MKLIQRSTRPIPPRLITGVMGANSVHAPDTHVRVTNYETLVENMKGSRHMVIVVVIINVTDVLYCFSFFADVDGCVDCW